MRRTDCRSERHDIEVRILAQNDGALQSGMVDNDVCLLTEEFLILSRDEVEYLTLRVRIPSAVVAGCLHAHSSHIERALQRGDDVLLVALA